MDIELQSKTRREFHLSEIIIKYADIKCKCKSGPADGSYSLSGKKGGEGGEFSWFQ